MKSLISALLCFAAITLSGAPRPNIVMIIADDLGYNDVGFTGGKEIKTPHLDKLATSGARLDAYYVQPVCTPTRAALMTGRYPMRYGFQAGVLRPWEKRGLPLEERTLPQALKTAGYTTAISGKWHLGHYQPEYQPTRRGFDHQYGHYCGAIDYFTHERDGGFDWHRNDRECRDEGYSTELIAREAVHLIEEFDAAKPFFLYVPFNAVHTPHQVPGKYKEPYQQLPEPRRTYAGMVAAMDEGIGRIHDALKRKGVLTNTLLVFSSDNGGPSPGRVTDNGSLRGSKGTLYEGGVRVCAFAAWEGRIKPGETLSTPMHAVDWYPTLLKLAGASTSQEKALDGQDIWPVLSSGERLPTRPILLNTTASAGALRLGNWKYIIARENPAGKKRKARPQGEELYDLSQDRSEKSNLAERNPEMLKALRELYEGFAKQALPPGNQPQPQNFKAPRVWGEAS